jgi:hypothetical protein
MEVNLLHARTRCNVILIPQLESRTEVCKSSRSNSGPGTLPSGMKDDITCISWVIVSLWAVNIPDNLTVVVEQQTNLS